ncbi:MAG: hypothetical protein QXQ57_04755 [Sulfolobales archaeon]
MLIERDQEDAEMLRYAALAYAKFCLIHAHTAKSEDYYTPSYMLIVSDDDDVYSSRHLLNYGLREALRKAMQRGILIGRYPGKLVSVAKWNGFKEYVLNVTILS